MPSCATSCAGRRPTTTASRTLVTNLVLSDEFTKARVPVQKAAPALQAAVVQ